MFRRDGSVWPGGIFGKFALLGRKAICRSSLVSGSRPSILSACCGWWYCGGSSAGTARTPPDADAGLPSTEGASSPTASAGGTLLSSHSLPAPRTGASSTLRTLATRGIGGSVGGNGEMGLFANPPSPLPSTRRPGWWSPVAALEAARRSVAGGCGIVA